MDDKVIRLDFVLAGEKTFIPRQDSAWTFIQLHPQGGCKKSGLTLSSPSALQKSGLTLSSPGGGVRLCRGPALLQHSQVQRRVFTKNHFLFRDHIQKRNGEQFYENGKLWNQLYSAILYILMKSALSNFSHSPLLQRSHPPGLDKVKPLFCTRFADADG